MSLKKVLELWKGRPVEELLLDLYIKQDLSIPQVAEELNISVGSVHKWLSDYGISKQNELYEKNLV